MRLKKLLFISLFSTVSLNSIAAFNTENIEVTARAQAGCIVSAQDISFGDLQVSQSNRSIQAIVQAPIFNLQVQTRTIQVFHMGQDFG